MARKVFYETLYEKFSETLLFLRPTIVVREGRIKILRKFYFLVRNSLLDMSASTLAMKLKFERDKFGKSTVCNLQTKIRF